MTSRRVIDAAPEEEQRRRRIGPGQERTARGQPHGPSRDPEGAAAFVQPRPCKRTRSRCSTRLRQSVNSSRRRSRRIGPFVMLCNRRKKRSALPACLTRASPCSAAVRRELPVRRRARHKRRSSKPFWSTPKRDSIERRLVNSQVRQVCLRGSFVLTKTTSKRSARGVLR
jgi:hypothetical protein